MKKTGGKKIRKEYEVRQEGKWAVKKSPEGKSVLGYCSANIIHDVLYLN